MQKTVRRALPLFSHLTFFHALIKKWCKAIARNSTSCNHTFFPCHLSPLLIPTPIAKPLQNHCKKHYFVVIYLPSASSATLRISLISRRTFNMSQRELNTPQDGRNVASGGAKTTKNLRNLAQDGSMTRLRWFQTGPRCLDVRSTWLRPGPRCFQTGPGCLKTGSRWLKTVPRSLDAGLTGSNSDDSKAEESGSP